MANLDELVIRLREQGSGTAVRGVELAERAVVKFGATLGRLATIGGVGGAINAAGMAAFAYKAIEAASDVEQITVRFAALNNSMEIGKQKMAYILDYADLSAGHFQDLAEAGSLLEGAGLPVERWLPVLDKLSSFLPKTRENVMEMASAFMRLPSGQIGESMEIFRRFGITIGDLAKEGVKFSKDNQLLSPIQDFLAAIERVSMGKGQRITDAMAKTFGVKMSNAGDAVFKSLARAGESMMRGLEPIIAAFTNALNAMTASGVFERIAQDFVDLAPIAKIVNDIPGAMLSVIAAFSIIPNILREAYDAVQSRMQKIRAAAMLLTEVMVAVWATGPIFAMISAIEKLILVVKDLGVVAATVQALQAVTVAGALKALLAVGVASGVGVATAAALNKLVPGGRSTETPAEKKAREAAAVSDKHSITAQYEAARKSWGEKLGMGGYGTPGGTGAAETPEQKAARLAKQAAGVPLLKADANVGQIANSSDKTARNTQKIVDALYGLRLDLIGGGPRAHARMSSIEVEISLAKALSWGVG